MRRLIWIPGVAAVLYLAATAALYFGQRALLYFPTPAVAIPGFERVEIDSNGYPLQLWTHPGEARQQALIYFGGNAESPVFMATLLASLFPQHTLYLPSYRGYGGSTGAPDEQALYADALALYDRTTRHHERISVIGRSLGSGVATYLAAHRSVNRLVLATPMDSITTLAEQTFPMFPVRWLLTERYDSVGRAAEIDAPTLMITAGHDDVVPAASSARLAEALVNAPLDTVVVDDAGHNNIADKREFAMALLIFLGELPAPRT